MQVQTRLALAANESFVLFAFRGLALMCVLASTFPSREEAWRKLRWSFVHWEVLTFVKNGFLIALMGKPGENLIFFAFRISLEMNIWPAAAAAGWLLSSYYEGLKSIFMLDLSKISKLTRVLLALLCYARRRWRAKQSSRMRQQRSWGNKQRAGGSRRGNWKHICTPTNTPHAAKAEIGEQIINQL